MSYTRLVISRHAMPSLCRRHCAVQVLINLAAQEVATPPPSLLAKLGHALSIHLFLQVAALCQGPQPPILCYCHPHQHNFISRTDVHSPKYYPNWDSFSPAWGLPSLDLSALLSSPLSAPPATKAGPLVISPALPPIPAKIVERVQSGFFVNFKKFLADNVLLVQRLQELSYSGAHLSFLSQSLSGNSRLREINDLLTWASWFLAFMATRLEL